MNKKIFISFVFFLCSKVLAQGPDTLWTKSYGGIEKDRGNSLCQTLDGGYIIAGYTESFGSGQSDVWLIKTDSFGNIKWTKTYGSPGDDFGNSVAQTSDGGYIICGNKASVTPEGYGWLIKTDSIGNAIWTKEFSSYPGPGCSLQSVKETLDSGYITIGKMNTGTSTYDDIYLVKTNLLGEVLWSKTFGSYYYDFGYCVVQTSDGGYTLVGTYCDEFLNSIIWLLKTDAFGDTTWTKIYSAYKPAIGHDVKKTNDGGYIIVGAYLSGIYKYLLLLKTNEYGDTIWTKTFGGYYGNYEGYSVQQTYDGGYIITGEYYYPTGGNDLIIFKTDDNGNLLWDKSLGSSIGRSIQQTTDFGYVIVGSIYNNPPKDDVWLIKTKPITVIQPNGFEIFTVGDTVNIYWISECITDVSIELSINNGLNWNTIIDSAANTGIYSWVVYSSDSSDQCLIKISSISDSSQYDVSNNVFTIGLVSSIEDDISNDYPKEYALDQNLPNPFNPNTKISWQAPVGSWQTLKVYDLLGNEVATLVDEYKPAGKYEVVFDASSLTSGVYFYQLMTESYIETKKMILLK